MNASALTPSILIALGLSAAAAFCLGRAAVESISRSFAANRRRLSDGLEALHIKLGVPACGRLIVTATLLAAASVAVLLPPSSYGVSTDVAPGESIRVLGLLPFLVVVGACAGIGFLAPMFGLHALRARWRQLVDSQLVDTLTLLGNALRAGRSLTQSFELVRDNMPRPTALEFGRMLREIQFIGRSESEVLRSLADRSQSKDMKLVVLAVATLLEKGGNLAASFSGIAETIRQRKKVEGKIQALTMLGISEGVLALLVPIAFLALLRWTSPELTTPLFTTPLGWVLLSVAFTLNAVGAYSIYRIVQVEV